MKNKEQQLESIREWANASISDCCKSLEENDGIVSARMKCGDLLIGDGESVQVQVIATRYKDDFLGDFDRTEKKILSKEEYKKQFPDEQT